MYAIIYAMSTYPVIVVLILLITAPLCTGGCAGLKRGEPAVASAGRTPEMIKKAGRLRAGVHGSIPKFGMKSETASGRRTVTTFSGFEVEIARLLARDILGDPNRVDFVDVDGDDPRTMLDKVTVDVVIATFGRHSPDAEHYNISAPYFNDGTSLMVKRDAPFSGLAGIGGRRIGYVRGDPARQNLENALSTSRNAPQFFEFAQGPEARGALDAGALDGFAGDRVFLARFTDNSVILLPDSLAPREFGGVTKLSNTELAIYVDQRVQQWTRERLFDGLLTRFGIL